MQGEERVPLVRDPLSLQKNSGSSLDYPPSPLANGWPGQGVWMAEEKPAEIKPHNL